MTNLGCSLRSFIVPMVDISQPRPATMQVLYNHLVLAPELGIFLLEVFDYQFFDLFRSLRGYESVQISLA